ncbi:MAG: response regulator [Rhabdaerophilum sp.]|jgi:CheY-like chemotaxis protein|nr:response regulator [Methylobacterium sp.]MCA3597374.1 response regulator [Methylobacterium sp.]MCA3600212.1 response regulator [Methylobacterium sp.]MCA3602865.1 response regulator [Methylobacterium sp.]MCA3606265.1 response regulator [Methylobacterium sp.]
MVRILLVDDDEAVRAPLARALALDGHAVTEASDGAHALETFTEDETGFDLMVSDIRMPVMDGIQLALAVAAKRPGFPIVLMTGYAEQRERAKELEGLVDDVLIKPFPLGDFRRIMREVIARRIPGA